jgi:hypothetical protein
LKKLKNSLLALFMICGLLLMTRPVAAQTVSSTRDNDANAVIKGGCLTIDECQQKFNDDASVRNIFSCFHINTADMNAMGTTAVVGEVTDNNTVIVNGKVIATHAVTAGRQNIAGSTESKCGNFPFFMRPPSVSFASSRLSAFVVMDSNNQSDFAILTSCGNPVIATPVKVKTTAAPATTTPAEPAQSQEQQQQQQQEQTVVINSTQPQVAEQQQAQPAAQTQTQAQAAPAPVPALPNTGAGAVAVTGLATIFGTVGHLAYQRYYKRV